MHIHIKGKTLGVHLWAPLAIFKLRSVRKKLFQNDKKQAKKFIRILKTYIKKNGHFILLDIQEQDGPQIKIKI